MRKQAIFVSTLIFVVVGLTTAFFFRGEIREQVYEWQQPQLPAELVRDDFVTPEKAEEVTPVVQKKSDVVQPPQTQSSTPAEVTPVPDVPDLPESTLPPSINLRVDFASQAPLGDWGMPYQEACEEATAIMLHYFYKEKKLTNELMDEEILKLVEWEKNTLGHYEHTDAQEISRILKEYFGYKNVEVKYDFNEEDLTKALAQGQPVIVPSAGRLLGNPNFTQPGPPYHALLVKGYLEDGRFITNDPGTRRGKDYIYSSKVLMNAAHDWVGTADTITTGRRVMIVVTP